LPPLPKNYRAYLLLALTLMTLALLPDSWQAVLQYSRAGIANGHYWQLFTGHLLHSNYWHLLMNLGGLLLATLLHGSYFNARQVAWQWLLSVLIISSALYLFSEDIQVYVGLSGLLHALFTLGAIADIQRQLRSGWLILLGIIAKVVWEQWHGPDAALSQLIGANVAIDAHLYGVLSGLSIAASHYLHTQLTRKTPHH
jgi:rhomboid family GlyGly-CTERM serine protease